MTNALRTVLHDLAPEPPHGLGEVAAARRRARALRRRRRYGAASVVVLSLVALFGYTVVGRPAPVTPAGAPAGAYPDWPRRGDGPKSLDTAAVRVWERSLAEGVRRYGDARVLYATAGERPVVVLHAVATRGGERLVVVTGPSATALEVQSDVPAPTPGTVVVAVLLDRPAPGHFDDVDCGADPLTDPSAPTRLLAIARPGMTSAAWWATPPEDSPCAGDRGKARTPEPLPFTDAVGLVPTRLGPRATVNLRLDQSTYATYLVDYPNHSLREARPGGGPAEPYGWEYRNDGSRADDLWETVFRSVEIGQLGGYCAPFWYGSLPDGTGAVLCVTATVDGRRHVVLAAERADRGVAIYLESKSDPQPTALAAIVDGLDGRWLVVVGSDELTSLTLVDRGVRTPIPLRDGAGFLKMEREPSDEAYLTNSEYGPGGGFAIQDRTGRVLARRY
jgi:hypothetical protein